MANEYRSEQGSIIPRLFIGLGGIGSRMIDRIASRAKLLPNWESQLRPLTHFVSIDTNELDQHKLKHVPDGNRINIAGFDKQKVVDHFRRSNDRQALQWIDRGYKPRAGVKPGAGQIRVESRLGFFYHSLEIRSRLEELVDASLKPGVTWRQQHPPKYEVYIYCTLAGGTGSGSFLSTAYLIDEIIRQKNWQPRVIGSLLLSTVLLDKVGAELHFDIHANAYAALKELEHLTKLDYKQVKDEGRTKEEFVYCRSENVSEIKTVSSRPFFLSFIVDQPPHVSVSDIEKAVADAGFLQIFTPIIDNLASELDNYEKKLEGLTRFPGRLKDVGLGYTQNFAAFGAAAMLLPAHDLLEYCALRFAAQAIRSQITFGVDASDSSDDRVRGLAKLAVNYSDPKFLRMSDDAREQTINASFVNSVQEMARQDEKEEMLDGFWYQLVESVDVGRVTGVDKNGEPIRGESLIATIARKLTEARTGLLNKISIKERAFVFHREGLNQYVELVSRLTDDIRKAKQIIDEGKLGLVAQASEGEVIAELTLDPISERYLVIRLLDKVENALIAEAKQQQEKAWTRDVNNPKVRERLERELYENLREAAERRPLFKRDQPFLDARDEAQEYYRGVAAGARKSLDAEIQLQQLRALLDYLKRRCRQYARLATRMNSLVQELEAEAERFRKGEAAISPILSLRVEALETLEEPRQRVWSEAYYALFVDEGKYLSTFDRKLLAVAISNQLKPVVRPDGSVAEKSVEQTVTDLRRALIELGRQRMVPTIFGDMEQPGMDLINALELEARLILKRLKKPGEYITSDEIDEYREKKFRALLQMADIFARISSADAKALDDGVTINKTRQVIHGIGGATIGQTASRFIEQLKSILSASGKQVKIDTWHDPRLIVVHDVELPIPLYYWQPVVGVIEEAYLKQASDERRGYHLHTDFNWEKSLPNLNPNHSEIVVGWSLKTLADGLICKAIQWHKDDKIWIWKLITPNKQEEIEPLGQNLSSALYRIGEFHRLEELQVQLERQIETEKNALCSDGITQRREALLTQMETLLNQMNRRELHGSMTREDILDRPIIRTLIVELRKGGQSFASAHKNGDTDLYSIFSD